MVIKLSMYVVLHDVYPAMDVNFAFRRKVKMITSCNFVPLEDKMRKRKKKRKEKKKEKNF